jgi:hypothetical protein
MSEFPLLIPAVQQDFYQRLLELDARMLFPALSSVVDQISLEQLDQELRQFVNPSALRKLASHGLRGEVFFATPVILNADPHLVGYYRTLYGFSQKEWYNAGPFGRFHIMESKGKISVLAAASLAEFCASINQSGSLLLESLTDITLRLIRDLQLLTLGPQLRGSRNTRLGAEASTIVHRIIRKIVHKQILTETTSQIIINNDSGRKVIIAFAEDPDVAITSVSGGVELNLVAMEIKGGSDGSNILNRLGEAEKSHHKARELGYHERWTILKVEITPARAKKNSPSTTQFFDLDRLATPDSATQLEFISRLHAILGISAGGD